MAEYYCDHGAYGLASNRIGLDAPTWGVPQEGDGFSKDAATASAVAEIQILVAPTAAETINIAGATISAGASAAANTFVRGADAAACATNIVTLINSANFTATVSTNVVTATGIAAASNQGRNLFYARIKPATTDTVQIMWRIGSAALNHAANANVVISTSTAIGAWTSTNVPTLTQFIGGTSGCWGWLASDAALGQGSSIAARTYGFLMSRPTIVRSGAGSTTGTYGLYDPVFLRSGSGQQVSLTVNSNVLRVGNAGSFYLLADTNTKWTSDSGTGVIDLRLNNTNSSNHAGFTSNNSARFGAVKKGVFKLSGHISGSGTGISYGTYSGYSGDMIMENMIVEEATTTTVSNFAVVGSPVGNSGGIVYHYNTTFNLLKASSVGRTMIAAGYSTYQRGFVLRNCEFNFNYTGVASPTQALVTLDGSAGNTQTFVHLSGIALNGLGAYKQKIFANVNGWASNAYCDAVADGVSNGDIGGTGVAPWTNVGGPYLDLYRRIFCSTPEVGGSWRLELATGAADWVNDGSFPTLAGISPGGVASSMRVFWLPAPTGQNHGWGFTAPPLKQQSRGSDGVKNVNVEFLSPTSIALNLSNFRVTLTYVDTTGIIRTQEKHGGDVESSAASWSGSFPNHSKKKVAFTTDYPVRQWADVSIEVTVTGPNSTGSMAYLYVDTGFTVLAP